MIYFAASVGLVLVLSTLLDAFEVVLLPRPVRRRWRVNRFFFRWTWGAWSWLARKLCKARRREDFFGVFGPLSMVSLFGTWAASLMIGFGLLHWALQQYMGGNPLMSLSQAMGVSGDAFFTLGYGDVVPRHAAGRLLVIVEAGTGFGFIALTISYLPVLYQHFSRRDYQLIDLSARAGTPPTAAALLAWHATVGCPDALNQWLRDWEIWASDLIESHSAYPMLAFYRSQHEGHSWLAALAVVLDTCALLIAGGEEGGPPQAAATFTAARRVLHVVADSLEVVPSTGADTGVRKRGDLASMSPVVARMLPGWRATPQAEDHMARLAQTYEPYLGNLSKYLALTLPAWNGPSPTQARPDAREDVIARLTSGRTESED